jgi:starch synthase
MPLKPKIKVKALALEPVLHTHHIKYGGVVNGIDYDVWNPEVDPHIPVQYGVDSARAQIR